MDVYPHLSQNIALKNMDPQHLPKISRKMPRTWGFPGPTPRPWINRLRCTLRRRRSRLRLRLRPRARMPEGATNPWVMDMSQIEAPSKSQIYVLKSYCWYQLLSTHILTHIYHPIKCWRTFTKKCPYSFVASARIYNLLQYVPSLPTGLRNVSPVSCMPDACEKVSACPCPRACICAS